MWIVTGGHSRPLERTELLAAAAAYRACLVDLGTGDGRFVYRYARDHPETFCLGLDAVREAMRKTSSRAARKPARGGLGNLFFVAAAVEALPGPLAGLATLLTVNYPWGSLLRSLVVPDAEQVAKVAAVMRPGASWSVLINHSVFEDPAYRQRLGLPELPPEGVRDRLLPAYRAAGLTIDTVELLGAATPHRTSWGQRLVRGGGRKTLVVEGGRVATRGRSRPDEGGRPSNG